MTIPRALRFGILAGLLLLSAARPAAAADGAPCRVRGDGLGWYVPDYAKLQTGGYLGFVTVGTGYTLLEIMDLGLFYGWVPELVGGTDIHTFAFRLGARVRGVCLSPDWNWVFVQGAVGALFTFGDGFFQSVPDRYPNESYYRATGRRLLLTLGSEISLRQEYGAAASHAAFVEVTALDEYLHAWWLSRESIALWEVFGSSIGYRLRFR